MGPKTEKEKLETNPKLNNFSISLVSFKNVENVVDVRVDQLGPGLPQRLHDEADEPNLET